MEQIGVCAFLQMPAAVQFAFGGKHGRTGSDDQLIEGDTKGMPKLFAQRLTDGSGTTIGKRKDGAIDRV